jgi:hypothetical protein
MAEDKRVPSVSGGRSRKRFRSLLNGGPIAIVGAIIIGLAAGGGVTEGIDAAAGPTSSNSMLTTGQVTCPSYGKQAIGVTGMQFQMSNGRKISAMLSDITDSTGSKTNWDHFSADIPASAAGPYVVRVTCGGQENWTPRVTGTDSRTIICGVVDGECTALLPGASISQAHPPYQKGVPESPHTPEPTPKS